MTIEDDLKRTLQREAPPAGFASRVLQRIERDETTDPHTAPRRRRWWRTVAASLTLTGILGAWGAREIHERREGERAKEEVLLALRIAGEKVRYAQHEVRDIGSKH